MENARRSLFTRALHGSALTAGSYALMQFLRLASNLILTRLLFPEAFGLMALVSVFMVGLAMFSDMGVGPAISQSPRGDDPDFLDTAWTIQVARGVLLWALTAVLGWPAAHFYGAPELAALLPVSGATLFLSALIPTRYDTANRHLLLGRVTALDLVSQVCGIVVMVVLAAVLHSVWSLVLGAVVGAMLKLLLMHWGLPGHRNRLRWEPRAGAELVHFGKWIFLSTACGFLLAQGDKAILGAFLHLDALGIYNIGYFLASFPLLLGGAVTGRIMIPLYRDHHPASGGQDFTRLRRLRLVISGGILLLLGAMIVGGPALVALLYDPRYAGAGAIVVAVALVQMPMAIGITYDQSALAAGDSRNYFLVMAARAAVQTAAFLAGVWAGGLGGALLAQGLAMCVMHAAIVWLARRHRAWDAPLDAGLALLALAGLALALLLHGAELASL